MRTPVALLLAAAVAGAAPDGLASTRIDCSLMQTSSGMRSCLEAASLQRRGREQSCSYWIEQSAFWRSRGRPDLAYIPAHC